MPIDKKTFQELKKMSGIDLSSWTIWSESEDGRPKSGTGDVSLFDKDDICNHLTPNYIFVGLNAGTHDLQERETECTYWTAFHSNDTKKSQDFKLRYALDDSKFWGSYITDLIKNHPTSTAKDLLKDMKENPSILRNNAELLEQEIAVLKEDSNAEGKDITIIGIGTVAYNLLNKALGSKYEIKKIPHYSCFIGKEKYKERVWEVLKDI